MGGGGGLINLGITFSNQNILIHLGWGEGMRFLRDSVLCQRNILSCRGYSISGSSRSAFLNLFKPELTIDILIHYNPRLVVDENYLK